MQFCDRTVAIRFVCATGMANAFVKDIENATRLACERKILSVALFHRRDDRSQRKKSQKNGWRWEQDNEAGKINEESQRLGISYWFLDHERLRIDLRSLEKIDEYVIKRRELQQIKINVDRDKRQERDRETEYEKKVQDREDWERKEKSTREKVVNGNESNALRYKLNCRASVEPTEIFRKAFRQQGKTHDQLYSNVE